MLIDEFLPNHQFAEVHSIQVAGPSQQVLRAAKQITPKETPRFGVLMRLRALPDRLAGHERLELAAHRKFRAYWALIRPWGSLIRREWLAAVQRRAEGAAED